MTTPDEIATYWFGPADAEPDARSDLWWGQVDDQGAVDDEIEDRFGTVMERALEGELEEWRSAPESCLALILLLDQFPRHVHRGTARAFAGGERAVSATRHARKQGWDLEMTIPECLFLYMPLMHAEDEESQSESIEAYERLVERAPPETVDMAKGSLEFAREHAEIVEQFGRYPYRNTLLGRESTPEEEAWLEDNDQTYGQDPA
jgi:uncharacterized protein (DUF924 family)